MKFLCIFALILAVCGLAFAVPQTLVGSDKCTRGPGYWCKDRATAQECKAIQHCETKVWNKQN